jgi:hypothetical protein
VKDEETLPGLSTEHGCTLENLKRYVAHLLSSGMG